MDLVLDEDLSSRINEGRSERMEKRTLMWKGNPCVAALA